MQLCQFVNKYVNKQTDINPGNVVVVGKSLKLNDFNIGIMQKWNLTSNNQCGFPSQYPNAQWRSPGNNTYAFIDLKT